MKIKPEPYLNDEAKKYFARIVKHLEAVDAIEDIDSFGLSIMSMDLALFHNAASKCIDDGGVQVTPNGYTQVTGYMTVMDKCKSSFLKYSEKFGMSPKDREKMLKFSAPKDDGDDTLQTLLKKKNES